MSAEPRTPLRVQCKPCSFVWTAAYLPMEAGKITRLLRKAHCPMCAASSRQITIAPDEPATTPARIPA